MSSYMSFYVKKDDTFIKLFHVSRNSYVYSYLYGPYGTIEQLTEEKIDNAIDVLEILLNNQKADMVREQEKLKAFGDTRPSFEDWNKAYWSMKKSISEIDDIIKETEDSISQLSLLNMIARQYKYSCFDMSLWNGVEVPENNEGSPIIKEEIND